MCPCHSAGSRACSSSPCRPKSCRTCILRPLPWLEPFCQPLLLGTFSRGTTFGSSCLLFRFELRSLFFVKYLFSLFLWQRPQQPEARQMLRSFLFVVIDIEYGVNVGHTGPAYKINRNNMFFIDIELACYLFNCLCPPDFTGSSSEQRLYLTPVQKRVPAVFQRYDFLNRQIRQNPSCNSYKYLLVRVLLSKKDMDADKIVQSILRSLRPQNG